MKARTFNIILALVLIIGLTFPPFSAAQANFGPPKSQPPKVLLFSADGMRPDLMEKYVAERAMPTYKELIRQGLVGANGMVQAFPPNTGVGWYTMATGTYPSEHGSTNNTFFRSGDSSFNNSTSAFSNGVLQADTIAEAAERAGKKVVSLEWSGGSRTITPVQGPVVDYRTFSSNRGLWTNWDVPGQPAGASAFGVQYQRNDLVDAAGWTNVPASFSPAKEGLFDLGSYLSGGSPVIANDQYDFYVFDSTNDHKINYNRVLVVPNANTKDGSKAVANLKAGEWADVKVVLANPAGKTAGFYVKAMRLAPDLSQVSLFFTSVARSVATCNGCSYSGDFQDDLNRLFPSSTGADYAIFESGLVDAATYIEQGLMWKNAHWTYLSYILGKGYVPTVGGGKVKGMGYQPDLLMLGTSVTDEFSHMFLGLTVPDVNGIANPYYNTYTEYGEVITPDKAYDFIREAYKVADGTLALGRMLMGGNPTTFALSDHGFGSQWLAVNSGKVLHDAGLLVNGDGSEVSSNCRAATGTDPVNLAKSCVAGGTAQIYVNTTLPSGTTYDQVRQSIVDAFQNLADPDNPGAQVVLKILMKEELRNVDGSDSLHPNRSGDVVVVLKPPYQFDASTKGQTIAFSQFFGQHGFLPETVDFKSGVNMHATFVAAGPGIRHQGPVPGVRAVDVAPTAAFLLKIPGPINARGKILTQLLSSPGQYKQVSILSLSDFHGQLTPLAETADTVGPSFAIGGAAFLRPWFDVYRAESGDSSLTVSAGDLVGASPPISNFFGDKPTIELMNQVGLNLNALGNHEFDRGQEYLRNELIPLANFRYIAANVVFPNGKTPPEWAPSVVLNFKGFKLGVIGYTLQDLPSLVFPGYTDPFVFTDPVKAVNKEAARLHSVNRVNAIIAVGHIGADPIASTLTNPVGDLVSFAGALKNVDAVVGGHTHIETIGKAPNGVLIAENTNAGVRFTRIRLVVDTNTKAVIYKTADFHKPWDIGMTPDPEIQGRIDDLNSQLAPIFNTVIGDSSVFVPRSDSCGQSAGRTCESLVGDVTTDAMRTAYNVDFAITNSGGLRADLTCPTTDIEGDFCPAYTPPPYPITRGQVLAVLPFGNIVTTASISGEELKAFLEGSVSLMPSVQGRFPQVSGLCFTYDISAPAGSRVLDVVRQAADGTCTGAAVDLTAASTYTIAENDYMAKGGDGYPDIYSRSTTQNIMDQVLADYIAGNTPISPSIQGRIVCTSSGATACP